MEPEGAQAAAAQAMLAGGAVADGGEGGGAGGAVGVAGAGGLHAQPPTPQVVQPVVMTVHGITQGLFDAIGSVQEACAAVGLIDQPQNLTMIGIVRLLGEDPAVNLPLTVFTDITDTEFEANVVQQFNIVSPPIVEGGQPVTNAPSMGQVARLRRARTICIAKTQVVVPVGVLAV